MTATSIARPAFFRSAMRVFDLSLGLMLWSKRSIFLGVLVGAPVLLGLVVRLIQASGGLVRLAINGSGINGPVIFGLMMWLLYVRFIVPVLGVFYGTALIADEVEDKTITYLFTRPISRGSVLLGRYLAYLVCTTLLILPSAVVAFFLIVPIGAGSVGELFPTLLADLGMLIAGLATYGALFALVGARLKRPLVAGLVFAFGWEPGVLVFPGYLKQLTVAYYLQALVPQAMPDDSFLGQLLQAVREVPNVAGSLVALLLISAGALWLAVRTVEAREYVLEQ